jgi:hypothetical protein
MLGILRGYSITTRHAVRLLVFNSRHSKFNLTSPTHTPTSITYVMSWGHMIRGIWKGVGAY